MSRKKTKYELTSDQKKSVAALLGARDFQGELAIAEQRIAELEAGCRSLEIAEAEAMALVLSHEGHIEKQQQRIAELEALRYSLSDIVKRQTKHIANLEQANSELKHKANQYDAVVKALNVCDGGRYRNDTIERVIKAAKREVNS